MDLRKLAKRALSTPSRVLSLAADRNTIILLRKRFVPTKTDVDFTIEEHSADVEAVLDIYKTLNRYNSYKGADDDARMQSRIENGMRFFAAVRDGNPIAYLWFHTSSDRFFDEIGLFIKNGSDDLWLRDMYVAPEQRGRRLFATVLNAVISQYFPACCYLYSDVDSDNIASLKAHHRLGLEQIGKVSFTRVFKVLLSRGVQPETLQVHGYRHPQNFLRSDENFRAFVRQHLC